MNMLLKAIIGFIVAATFSLGSSAQVKFFAFAGGQSSNVKYAIQHVKQPTDPKFGFHAGAGIKVDFENHLYFAPTISFSNLGYKVKFNKQAYPPSEHAIDNSTSIHQLDIDALLEIDAGNNPNHLFFKAGPAFNVVLSGKEKFHLDSGGYVNREMNLGLYNSYGRYLASFVGCVGYETSSGLYFNLQYAHGLLTMNNAENGPEIMQRIFSVSVGWLFHSKKIVMDTKVKE